MDKAPDAFRTISEVADDLDIPQHVLRFWETRFAHIKPMKRGGGRRYYRPDDVDLLRGIRHLLYGEGYTIRGVQRILKDNGVKFVQSVWRQGAPQPEPPRAEDGSEEMLESVPPEPRLESPRFEEPEAEADDHEVEEEELVEMRAPVVAAPPISPMRRENATPVARPAPPPPTAPPLAPAGLPPDDLRKLQATLYELGECRRLIEAALKED